MVPVDFSPISQEALSRAIAFAAERNASLVLFHVVEPIIHRLEFVIVPPEMDEINLRELMGDARVPRETGPIASSQPTALSR